MILSESMALSEGIFLHKDHIAHLVQKLLDLEVDSVVLSKELTKLGDMSSRIDESCRDLRLSLQEHQ